MRKTAAFAATILLALTLTACAFLQSVVLTPEQQGALLVTRYAAELDRANALADNPAAPDALVNAMIAADARASPLVATLADRVDAAIVGPSPAARAAVTAAYATASPPANAFFAAVAAVDGATP